tara:strand:+ start:6253 stop:6498 length:246 start_codon:yes stop_codon:yes gene_type:complete
MKVGELVTYSEAARWAMFSGHQVNDTGIVVGLGEELVSGFPRNPPGLPPTPVKAYPKHVEVLWSSSGKVEEIYRPFVKKLK